MTMAPILDLVTVGLALGSSTRVQILTSAVDSPMTISELAEMVGVHQTTATYHCRVLLEAGLVIVDPVGCRRYVSLPAKTLKIPLDRFKKQPE